MHLPVSAKKYVEVGCYIELLPKDIPYSGVIDMDNMTHDVCVDHCTVGVSSDP